MCRNKRAVEASVPIPKPEPKPKPQPHASRSPFAAPSFSTTNTTSNNLAALFSTSISSSSLADLHLSLRGGDPILYSFVEIVGATNSFLYPPLSSSAGWHCSLHCANVAVVRRPFRGDPAALLACLAALCRSHHIAIARLLGVSLSGDDLYLVYEYVLGATLANCLRNPRNPSFSPLSSWLSHVQVAADLAQGLEYILHYSAGTSLHSLGQPSTSSSAAPSTLYNWIKSSSVLVIEPGFCSSMPGTAQAHAGRVMPSR